MAQGTDGPSQGAEVIEETLTFDELCDAQSEQLEAIRNILTNYSKCSKRNLTTKYLANKLKELEALWAELKDTDKEINENPNKNKQHEYFTNDFYAKASDWYNSIKTTLTTKLESPSRRAPGRFQVPNPPQTPKIPQLELPEIQPRATSSTSNLKFKLQNDRQYAISLMAGSITEEDLGTMSHMTLNSNIQTLSRQWDQFQKTHEELIINSTEEDLQNPYFTEDIYRNVLLIYTNTLKELQSSLDRITNQEHVTGESSHTTLPQTNHHNNRISPSHFQNLIPKFYGNQKDLHKFVSCCDDAFATLETGQDETVFFSVIKNKLSDKAYDVYKYNQPSNWPELKTLLMDQFTSIPPRRALQTRLNQIRQTPGESVKQFTNRINDVLGQLNEATYKYTSDKALLKSFLKDNEDQAVSVFEDGLTNPHLQTLAKVFPKKTLREISLHITEQAMRMHLNVNKTPNNYTGTSGNFRNVSQQYNNSQYASKARQPPPNLYCSYCRRPGHLIGECRTRARNNNAYSSQSNAPQTPNRGANNSYPRNIPNQIYNQYPRNSQNPGIPQYKPFENNQANGRVQRTQNQSSNQPRQNPTNGNFTRISMVNPHNQKEVNNIRNRDKGIQEQRDSINEITPFPKNQIQRGRNAGSPSRIETTAVIH